MYLTLSTEITFYSTSPLMPFLTTPYTTADCKLTTVDSLRVDRRQCSGTVVLCM